MSSDGEDLIRDGLLEESEEGKPIQPTGSPGNVVEEEEDEEELKEREREEKRKAEEEAARQKRLKVRKVSPIKKFFSSIRVVIILLLLVFFVISSSVIGTLGLYYIRHLYEDMDTLDMKERVQNAIDGQLRTMTSFMSRTMVGMGSLANAVDDKDTFFGDKAEQVFGEIIYFRERLTLEGPGYLGGYEYLPFHLLMIWDNHWNLRYTLYRPCKSMNKSICELEPYDSAFRDPAHGDFRSNPKFKEKVPKIFQEIHKRKLDVSVCDSNGDFNCTGIANIPEKEGGPMLFSLFSFGELSQFFGYEYAFDNWTILAGANALLFNEILANRTGLCVSMYKSTETRLPEYVKEEFEYKRNNHLILNAKAIHLDSMTFEQRIEINTGNLTMSQDYYSNRKNNYIKSDRSVCDAFYDHGDEDYTSMSTAYLAYGAFDFDTMRQGQKDIVMYRLEYHDPLTKTHVNIATIAVIVAFVVWFLTLTCVFLYFNAIFLIPLDRMRKMRADLIKKTLGGLEDDGLIAKNLFGDMTDDTALIEAGGDEITVMLTLQDRMDELYKQIIGSREDELDRYRKTYRNDTFALRIMNLFMRREDEALCAALPGLMDPNELARRYRRTTLIAEKNEDDFVSLLANAKHSFRTLKAVLNNTVAALFFKAFCIQRGRSSVNFLLLDGC